MGYAPSYGVFPQQPAEVINMADVLEGWQEHNQHILNQLKAGKDDAFLLQQSMEDSKNGFFTPLCGEQNFSSSLATRHIV